MKQFEGVHVVAHLHQREIEIHGFGHYPSQFAFRDAVTHIWSDYRVSDVFLAHALEVAEKSGRQRGNLFRKIQTAVGCLPVDGGVSEIDCGRLFIGAEVLHGSLLPFRQSSLHKF